jgi:flagellin-like protein
MLKGVSPLIAYVMVIMIVFSGITLVLLFGMPVIERAKESSIINEGLGNLRLLSKNIEEVVKEGIGSFRSINLKVTEGEYKINEKTNSIEFFYSPKKYSTEPGFFREDNILLISGKNAVAKEYDLDNDGENEIVLENDFIKVGILKKGSKENYEFINTSKLIKLITFKPKNVDLIPSDSSIFIDDKEESSYGYGYSEPLNLNKTLTKAEALVHLNTSYANYDILYTLYAGADFLTIKVINIVYK